MWCCTSCLSGDCLHHTDLLHNCRKPRKQSAESAFLSIIAAFAIFSALAGLLALLLCESHSPDTRTWPTDHYEALRSAAGADVWNIATGHTSDRACTAAGQYRQEPPKLKCVPPGAEERIAMFGAMHGFSHPISTSSSTAQKLFNQASCCCNALTATLQALKQLCSP